MRDRFDRAALRSVRTIVDDHLHGPVALVNGPRPRDEDAPAKAVKRHIAESSLVHLHEDGGLAIAVRRKAAELTRATALAAAVDNLGSLHGPLG